MAYWLFKSEPDVFSYDMLAATGDVGEPWTGVRNHQAKLNLRAMKDGDLGFYYHSNEGKAIVGVCMVKGAPFDDPTTPETTKNPWACVQIIAKEKWATPISLDAIKAAAMTNPILAEMVLVKNSRLSVQPVTEAEWAEILSLAGQ